MAAQPVGGIQTLIRKFNENLKLVSIKNSHGKSY